MEVNLCVSCAKLVISEIEKLSERVKTELAKEETDG